MQLSVFAAIYLSSECYSRRKGYSAKKALLIVRKGCYKTHEIICCKTLENCLLDIRGNFVRWSSTVGTFSAREISTHLLGKRVSAGNHDCGVLLRVWYYCRDVNQGSSRGTKTKCRVTQQYMASFNWLAYIFSRKNPSL